MADPQNPYRSWVVSASAGSGKTYQLSRRFLFLVGAGADPGRILTVTFTVRAVREMRRRIVAAAERLLADVSEQREFDAQLAVFRKSSPHPVSDPLPAVEVGRRILNAQGLLQIVTMDSVFRDWAERFHPQFRLSREGGVAAAGWQLLDGVAALELSEWLWERTCAEPQAAEALQLALEVWQQLEPRSGLDALRSLLQMLRGFELQDLVMRRETGRPLWQPIAAPPPGYAPSLAAAVKRCRRELEVLVAATRRHADGREAVAAADFANLVELKILTGDGRVHGGTFRGATRERLGLEIAAVERELAQSLQGQRTEVLNQVAGAVMALVEFQQAEAQKFLLRRRLVRFEDYARAALELWTDPELAEGMLTISESLQHVLLDEFQDTSLLQWAVFRGLIGELVSQCAAGDELPGTAFCVGDPKQSIYGFRHAEPEVMRFAGEEIERLGGGRVSLAASYRAAPSLMAAVNRIFAARLPDFPTHSTQHRGGIPVVKDVSRIEMSPFWGADPAQGDDEVLPRQREFSWVAARLQAALADPSRYPVWDKGQGRWRGLAPGDICILYRNATHSDALLAALAAAGVAARREEVGGFFSRPEVAFCMQLMEAVVYGGMGEAGALEPWVAVLCSPVGGWDGSELAARLAAEPRPPRHGAALVAWLRRMGDRKSAAWHQVMASSRRLPPHRWLLGAAQALEVVASFGGQLDEVGHNVLRLVDLVSDAECRGCSSLEEVVVHLAGLVQIGELSTATSGEAAVRVMTVHKSKGLEFPMVVVTGLGESWFRDDSLWLHTGGPNPQLTLMGPKRVQPVGWGPFEQLKARRHVALEQESLRLLYVALTRAVQYWVLSGHQPVRGNPGEWQAVRQAILGDSDPGSGEAICWDSPELASCTVGTGPCQGDAPLSWELAALRPGPPPAHYGFLPPGAQLQEEALVDWLGAKSPRWSPAAVDAFYGVLGTTMCGQRGDLSRLYANVAARTNPFLDPDTYRRGEQEGWDWIGAEAGAAAAALQHAGGVGEWQVHLGVRRVVWSQAREVGPTLLVIKVPCMIEKGGRCWLPLLVAEPGDGLRAHKLQGEVLWWCPQEG